jgi:hypothetical protein
LTDSVEKADRKSRVSNESKGAAIRINVAPAGGFFESKLRYRPLKIFFNTIDPFRTWTKVLGHRPLLLLSWDRMRLDPTVPVNPITTALAISAMDQGAPHSPAAARIRS